MRILGYRTTFVKGHVCRHFPPSVLKAMRATNFILFLSSLIASLPVLVFARSAALLVGAFGLLSITFSLFPSRCASCERGQNGGVSLTEASKVQCLFPARSGMACGLGRRSGASVRLGYQQCCDWRKFCERLLLSRQISIKCLRQTSEVLKLGADAEVPRGKEGKHPKRRSNCMQMHHAWGCAVQCVSVAGPRVAEPHSPHALDANVWRDRSSGHQSWPASNLQRFCSRSCQEAIRLQLQPDIACEKAIAESLDNSEERIAGVHQRIQINRPSFRPPRAAAMNLTGLFIANKRPAHGKVYARCPAQVGYLRQSVQWIKALDTTSIRAHKGCLTNARYRRLPLLHQPIYSWGLGHSLPVAESGESMTIPLLGHLGLMRR